MQFASIDLRTYADEKPKEQHDFVQIVLPMSGQLEIDVSGLQGRLSVTKGVFIHRDFRHSQMADSTNHSLIVDMDENSLSSELLDRFSENPFIKLNHRTMRLMQHMRGIIRDGGCDNDGAFLWSRILVDSFSEKTPDMASRLRALKTLIEIDPFQPWTVERMAQQTEVSASHLHVLFRDYFETTPHIWLARVRMRNIGMLLRKTSMSIAEIADRAGFSDQTALTRAMKKAMGTTPAAYRRAQIS